MGPGVEDLPPAVEVVSSSEALRLAVVGRWFSNFSSANRVSGMPGKRAV